MCEQQSRRYSPFGVQRCPTPDPQEEEEDSSHDRLHGQSHGPYEEVCTELEGDQEAIYTTFGETKTDVD